MGTLECPRCGVFNSDSSLECRCGLILRVDAPRSRNGSTKLVWTNALTVANVICAVIVPFIIGNIGLAIGVMALGTALAIAGTVLSAVSPSQPTQFVLNALIGSGYTFIWIGSVTNRGVL